MNKKLMLGAASAVITPRVGCHLFGYFPDIISTSVNDDLTATALVFSYGEERFALISLTIVHLYDDLVCRIRTLINEAYGIKPESCIIHTTHTHSGPSVSDSVGWGDTDVEYVENILIPGIMEATDKAAKNMVAVRMGVASGESLAACNRRELRPKNTVRLGQNPWGPFDPTMTVVSFKDEGGRTVANVIHYAAHCTAAGVNTEITRDWAGVMTDALSERTGAVTAFLNGPEGDVGPRLKNGSTTGDKSVVYALEHGKIAAEDALRIYDTIDEYRFVSAEALCGSLTLPLAPLPSYEEARAIYEKYKNATRNLRARQAVYYKEIMDKHERGYTNKPSVTEEQTVIRIGNVAFLALPYEAFAVIGLRIKQMSKIKHTLSIALANGSKGYFATEDQLCRGGYEIESFKTIYEQPLVDNADWYLVAHSVKNLNKLKEKE